jgi:glycine oxidase ThiO
MSLIPDIAIIGGGAAGLSTAVAAALAGARVTVLSRSLEDAALRAAAGMLAPNAEALVPGPLKDLADQSRALYPEYAAMLERLTGVDVGYVSRGDLLFPLLDGESAPPGIEEVGSVFAASALQYIEPALGPEVASAFHVPGDGQVDNRAMHTALGKACEVLGVNVLDGADVAAVVASPSGKSVDHLLLSSGERVNAAHYIVCAGAWTQRVLPNVPMRPVKGQMLCLEPRNRDAANPDSPQHILYGHGVYIVPKSSGRRFFVGATVEESAGFDRDHTAGGTAHLLSRAIQLVPAFARYAIVESWAGLRPASPDLNPILGMSEFDNLSIASGYYRNGVLLMPATAKIAAAVALGTVNELPLALANLIQHFSYTRFGAAVVPPMSEPSHNLRSPTTSIPMTAHPKTAPPPAVTAESGRDVPMMFRVLPDGTREPVYRGQTPSMFTGGNGDIKDQENYAAESAASEAMASTRSRAEAAVYGLAAAAYAQNLSLSPPSSEHLPMSSAPVVSTQPSQSSSDDGRASSGSTNPFGTLADSMDLSKISGQNDAYDDILAKRGDDEEDTTRAAMAANRSFGRNPVDGDKVGMSVSAEEWAAYEVAYAEGETDSKEFARFMVEDDPGKVATAAEENEVMRNRAGTDQNCSSPRRINGLNSPWFARGNGDPPTTQSATGGGYY